MENPPQNKVFIFSDLLQKILRKRFSSQQKEFVRKNEQYS